MNTLDLQEAAALAKCHPNTLRQKMKDGEAPGTKIGRAWVVTESTFMAWLDGSSRSAAAPAARRPGGRHRARKIFISEERLRIAVRRVGAIAKIGSPAIDAMPAKPVRLRRPPNYHVAKRRAAKMRRTPAWADMDAIATIYRECKRLNKATRIRHEVDHEIPLQGRMVSGLHVHQNLKIITRTENLKKHNHHLEAA